MPRRPRSQLPLLYALEDLASSTAVDDRGTLGLDAVGYGEQSVRAVARADYIDIQAVLVELHPRRVGPIGVRIGLYYDGRLPVDLANRGAARTLSDDRIEPRSRIRIFRRPDRSSMPF